MRRHGIEEVFIVTDYYVDPRRGTANYTSSFVMKNGVVLRQ